MKKSIRLLMGILASAFMMIGMVSSPAFAQEAASASEMKKGLTAVSQWVIEQARGRQTIARFEQREDKFWAKFDNQNRTPVREVEMNFTAEGMTWVGASGQRIVVRPDPKDAQTPFKGTDDNGGFYHFKPR